MSDTDTLSFIVSGPFAVERPGYDGKAYAWYIGPKRMEVRFTETALVTHPDGVSLRAEVAINTLGKSEVIEFLGWHEPPEWVEFSTDNIPWIEGGDPDGDTADGD